MTRLSLPHTPARLLAKLRIWLAERRASIMIITALSAPLLIAATGLAVDVSYMYQEQVALQAAADAAALAVSNAAAKYGISTQTDAATFATTGAGPYFAVAAANNATKSSYNFATSGNATISIATPTSSSGTNGTIWTWSATAQAPRGSFFSPVKGLGLYGLGMGSQAAGATADYVPAGGSNICFIATPASGGTGVVTDFNQGYVEGNNCSLYAGSTGSCPFNATGGGFIYGKSVYVPTVANETTSCGGNNKAYIGPTSTLVTTTVTVEGITAMTTAPPDLVTFLGTPPTGANQLAAAQTIPAVPTLSAGTNPSTSSTAAFGMLAGYSYNGGTNGNISSLLMSVGTSSNPSTLATTGTTLITDGIYSNNGMGTMQFGGTEVYIETTGSTGYTLDMRFNTANEKFTTPTGTSGTYVIVGATTFDGNGQSGETVSLGPGTYYFDGGTDNTGCQNVTTSGAYALCFNSNLTFTSSANTIFYVYGITYNTNNTTGTYTFGKGTYVFDGPVWITGGSTTFSGGTYWFKNGLYVENTASVTFGPGIYYFLGGTAPSGFKDTLFLEASNVYVNGATFVFEGQSNYEISNQYGTPANMILSAPTTNCVSPASYPLAGGLDSTGYQDGTGGEGICGVLIYKVPTDTAEDGIENDNQSTPAYFNGIVQEKGAYLDLAVTPPGSSNGQPGNGIVEASSGNYLEMEVGSLQNEGQTTLILSSGGGSGSGGSSISMLVK